MVNANEANEVIVGYITITKGKKSYCSPNIL